VKKLKRNSNTTEEWTFVGARERSVRHGINYGINHSDNRASNYRMIREECGKKLMWSFSFSFPLALQQQGVEENIWTKEG
jgi:hypothetical protein